MYRKLIKFGSGSHVISLPKDWIVKHQLNKGDSVRVDEENDVLIINAQEKKAQLDDREITINFTSYNDFKLLLSAAYTSNYKTINVKTENPAKEMALIRNLVSKFLALEIVQQGTNKVVIKDFCNIHDSKPADVIRRIDIVIRAMFEDLIAAINGEETQHLIVQKEDDVNKLSNFMFKLLNHAFTAQGRRILGVNTKEATYFWHLASCMEKVGDQIKRAIRHIDFNDKERKEVIKLLQGTRKNFEDAMRSHYKYDAKLALQVRENRKRMYEVADIILKASNNKNPLFFEKAKNLNAQVANIAQNTIKLNPRITLSN